VDINCQRIREISRKISRSENIVKRVRELLFDSHCTARPQPQYTLQSTECHYLADRYQNRVHYAFFAKTDRIIDLPIR